MMMMVIGDTHREEVGTHETACDDHSVVQLPTVGGDNSISAEPNQGRRRAAGLLRAESYPLYPAQVTPHDSGRGKKCYGVAMVIIHQQGETNLSVFPGALLTTRMLRYWHYHCALPRGWDAFSETVISGVPWPWIPQFGNLAPNACPLSPVHA